MRGCVAVLLLACVAALFAMPVQAQSPPPPARPEAPAPAAAEADGDGLGVGIGLRSLPRNILQDQQALFTTPFRIRSRQLNVVLPLGLASAVLIASDTAFEKHVTTTPSTASHFNTFSNAGLAALAGAGGGMYLWGTLAHNQHQRETGFLSGEAAIDAYLDTTLIKYVAGRDRPFTANGRGNFFDGGSSFPSGHAAISWAIASVIAHEYPGPATKLLSYGLAGAVSAARIEAHQHFLSDAVIGSALGWYLGRQVYRARSSDAEIDVRKWGKFERDEDSEQRDAASRMGSSYVPLDSWIYADFDRLGAMGYLPTATVMVRPWTRLESARLLAEAHDHFGEEDAERDSLAAPLLAALDEELAHETSLMAGERNAGAQVESVYARFTGISGTPLRDSFHFGQTLADDFGRPYGEGVNGIAGVSQRAEAGPLAFYVRGEYQYASAIPAYNAAAQQAIDATDGLPAGSAPVFGVTNRVRPIEAYVSLNLSNWQLSLGQQSLWWGPGRSTAFVMSNNAEAMPMVRLDRVSPLNLPALGPTRTEFFLARVGGTRFVRLGPTFVLNGVAGSSLNDQPYIWGFNASFKPTMNFEFGLGITTMIAGLGRPLNLQTFVHSFSSSGNAQPVDPGDRRTEFNFCYRVPGIRNWLTLYADGFAEDEPLPLFYPRRSAINPGVYLASMPGMRKLDLRLEGVYTNLPGLVHQGFFYFNLHYADGYRNYGQVIGSWIGRQGSGGTATGTYWFSARNKLAASYRKMVADPSFLQGGQLQDVSGSVTWMLRPEIELSATSQYEWWKFPLLASGTRTDVATTVEVRFFPPARLRAAGKQP